LWKKRDDLVDGFLNEKKWFLVPFHVIIAVLSIDNQYLPILNTVCVGYFFIMLFYKTNLTKFNRPIAG